MAEAEVCGRSAQAEVRMSLEEVYTQLRERGDDEATVKEAIWAAARHFVDPQPPPRRVGELVCPRVEAILRGAGFPDIADQISARAEFGFRRYGMHLCTENGRDFPEDAKDEALDFMNYYTGAAMRGDELGGLKRIADAMRVLMAHFDTPKE